MMMVMMVKSFDYAEKLSCHWTVVAERGDFAEASCELKLVLVTCLKRDWCYCLTAQAVLWMEA